MKNIVDIDDNMDMKAIINYEKWLEDRDKRENYTWWKPRIGIRTRVSKMSTQHIKNCIEIIVRENWRLHWKEPLLKELESR